ncbi:hypothetical protein [Oligosphaera ethanolica]|uniref:Uncharacterized protein n=1 Tax=Oligosphaera ethanolica TaxID=760260 RepID=A0AAE4AP44_9BACT|nr:hypothetical protein [Oligosphaera ethanolica]MDQ0290919.1 hypothetical protein [Oligosphaera ethanolica]
MAACLAAARQVTPPALRRYFVSREGAKTRSFCGPRLAVGFFVSREGAKARRRRFYPQITQMNADYGGMSCRCAASHAAGFKALFCLTRRRAGAQARRRAGAQTAFLENAIIFA